MCIRDSYKGANIMKAQLEKKFNKPIHKLFFIGIGGSSMSGLATMSLSQGFSIEGSDMITSAYIEKLEGLGIPVHIGHDYNNIPLDTDCVIYSAAIHEANPDMICLLYTSDAADE